MPLDRSLSPQVFDQIAPLYDEQFGRISTDRFFPILDTLVLKHLSKGADILDLCCGTGNFMQQLANSGFKITGLDISAKMLEFAQQRNPSATYLQADARDFSLPENFEAVVSMYDSLNFIDNIHKLILVF